MSHMTTSGGPGMLPTVPPDGDIILEVAQLDEKTAKAVIGRSPGQLAWLRLRRDRIGVVSGVILGLFVLVAILSPLIEKIYGEGPNVGHANLLTNDGQPLGYLGGVDFSSDNASHHAHILGVQPQTGRDIFMQLVYGARTSLLIAFSATIIATIVGILFGVIAAYVGGWVDSIINWFVDFMLAFPFLLFTIAIIPVVNSLLAGEAGEVTASKRILTIIIVFALFSWMSTARLIRGQVLSLREREYVEAARAAGAGNLHIMFRQILPNLWAPILVTFSLSVPATVTAEAVLSFLNIGVIEPTPDWGRMINDGVRFLQTDATYTMIPGISIFILVLAFNLFGDSLRDALDPKSLR